MSDFNITNFFNSITELQDKNAKVFINEENSKVELSKTKRSIFRKSESAKLNERANVTLTLLKAALESQLNKKGLEIYNLFVTGKKANGTQRLTVADFKAIKKAVDKELNKPTVDKDSWVEITKDEEDVTCRNNKELNLLAKLTSKADEFKNIDKNSSNDIRFLLGDYQKIRLECSAIPLEEQTATYYKINSEINDKIQKLTSMLNSKANTYKNFAPSFDLKVGSVIKSIDILTTHIANKVSTVGVNDRNSLKKYQTLQTTLQTLRTKYNDILIDFHKTSKYDILQSTEVPKKYFTIFKNVLNDAKKELAGIIKSSGYPNKYLVVDTNNEDLGKLNWNSISNNVEVKFGNTVTKLKSSIIPVTKLPNQNVDYDDNIHGIPSSAKRSPHLTNFCKTELTDSNNRVLFQGYRHGIVDAYGISEHETRVNYGKNKAMEFLKTIVADQFQDAINNNQGIDENHPIEFTINSLSLVSPLHFFEDEMQANQASALRALNNEGRAFPINVKIGDQEKQVFVKPNVNTYCFSTNFAGHGLLPMSKRTWHNGNRLYNNPGFNALFGSDISAKLQKADKLASQIKGLDVYSYAKFLNKFQDDAHRNTSLGRFLATTNEANKKKAYILYSEIQLLKQNRKYNDRGTDLFALPARIAMLSNLVGEITTFNCKSGKDRTGMLDVRVKALAARMDTVSNNFDAETYLKENSSIVNRFIKKKAYSDEDRKNVTTIAQDGGNLEIQQYNTGIKGSKVNDIKGVMEAFTDNASFKFIKGMSSFAKS